MAVLMSKRQQARNEKVLQELIKTVPGNDRCADCATRNPGWASWSFGIFLCMSCAALHRKMGTHISKVKSLSMDSWSSDQVENMKKIGNTASNKKYNPGNAKPDIPIDADEVGGAMERFIRRKYEFREFSGGSARRATIHNTGNASISSAEEQPPPLPPKPGKKFGFALRSSSATFSRPRMDKYTPPMSPTLSGSDGRESPPRMNKASRVFGSAIGNGRDDNFKAKMTALREMGFNDAEKNAFVLSEMHGSLSGAVEGLMRLGEGGGKPASRNLTPVSAASGSLNGLTVEKRRPSEVPPQAPPKDNVVDSFAALDNEPQPPRRAFTQPAPQTSQMQPQGQASSNPFLNMTSQTQVPQALQDSFAGMQISPAQQQQAYSINAPATMANNQHNPFMNTAQQSQVQPPPIMQQQQPQQIQQMSSQNPYAQPLQPQHTSNPFLRSTKSQTFSQPQSNPFMQQAAPQNPWLVAQAPMQSPLPQAPVYQAQGQPDFFNSQPLQQQQQPQLLQPQPSGYDQAQPVYIPADGNNPFYAQGIPQQPQHQPQQQQQQQQPFNPYQNYQTQQAPQQQQQQQPMSQYNRYDKASILQLYNYPQMAPSRPLQALPEEGGVQAATAPPSVMSSPNRSVTMPVSGTMNPFQSAGNGQPAPTNASATSNVYNHASRESMAFVGLGSGRQSPDAFAGLSARYGR